MSKTLKNLISVILTLSFLLSVLISCNTVEETTTDAPHSDATEAVGTEKETVEQSTAAESETNGDHETETEAETGKAEESETEEKVVLEGKNGAVIENAYNLANGVNAYFPSVDRDNFIIENANMSYDYALKHSSSQLVNSIKSASGGVYVENTMDVYVKLKNGNVFYASESGVSTSPNLYRMGYYLYELRLESQVFSTKIEATDSYELNKDSTTVNGIKRRIDENGDLYVMISNESDPYIVFPGVTFPAEQYNYLQIVMKTDFTQTRNFDIYLAAGSYKDLNNNQIKRFTVNPGEDYYTYNIPLTSITDYTGTVTKFRLDINAKKGENIYIKEIRLINAGETTSPPLSLNRSLFAFSDKLHERLQISASEPAENVAEVGMITSIDANTVEKLIVKDAKGTHTTLDGVDWNRIEGVGFDIKGVGIFGLILPKDGQGDKLTVTLEDGAYVIVQSRIPENNTIIPSVLGTENANDLYMGHRIYTDENHDFDAFLEETFAEWNPLTAKNFRVIAEESDNGSFTGYDPLRGVYVFTVNGGGFNTSYYSYPNKHYNLAFEVTGADTDRSVYLLAYSATGNLECAVLLNDESMMIPVPLEVGKNFKGDGEDNIYNLDDKGFSDVVFPLLIQKGEKTSYTLVDLYQNWGNFPLKQISWIQFHAPYYHLSTGVTETNCIVPWYTTKGARSITAYLPDHRAMSAPMWANQPQHTSGGSHALLQYTDADGNYSASENKRNIIDSYGPVYADIIMDFLTDDGKIRASYTHMEMPQTDENRAYYEIKYEVLEDVSFKDFKNDFSFYYVTDNSSTGTYKQFGYLNEQNESVVTKVNDTAQPVFYVLGDECPYFDYFDMHGETGENGYVNLSFLVYSSTFIIGGKESDASFIVKEVNNSASISLNLGEVTLKAGDTFTLNAIIMPWGSQESVYDSSEFAPDQNVRDVRQNTLLDPLVATAKANCEKIESPFLPRFRTTNGKSAEFTLSGGENNVAVRIYGFDLLTAPKVYELVDGNWVEYVLSSSKSPDGYGYYQYYDGYGVYYDGDGSYSYSFAVDMTGDAVRTFKIEADKEFEKWPEVEKIEIPDPIDLYLDDKDIGEQVSKAGGGAFSKTEMLTDDSGVSFIRFYGKNQADSYLNVYKGGTTPTGSYFVMKYRQSSTNPSPFDFFEIYTGTVSTGAVGSDGYSFKKAIIADDEWHILVCDIGARGKSGFAPNADGNYIAKYLRIDIFNAYADTDTTFDIAYVGMCDTIEEVFAMEPGFDVLTFSEAEDRCYEINRQGGKVTDETEGPINTEAFSYYYSAEGIQNKINQYGTNLGTSSVQKDGEQTYLNILSKEGGAAEGYFFFFINPTSDAGRYLTIKYRATATENFELWSSTSAVYTKGENAGQPKKNVAAPESHDYLYYNVGKGFQKDGEWHTLVIDLSAALPNYKSNENGVFSPYFFRMDLFSSTMNLDHTIEVDLAYVAFGDDLTAILSADKNEDQISYFDGTQTKILSTETGEPVS